MKAAYKKEYLIIILIIIAATAIGLYSSMHDKPENVSRAEHSIALPASDFIVATPRGILIVGQSSWQEVKNLFPQGKQLGMSTLYRPEGQSFFFEFSKKENLLTVVQIEAPGLDTPRGIKVGDTMEQVISAYGPYYSFTTMGDASNIVDLSYGTEDKVIFKLDRKKVSKIVIQHTVNKNK